MNRKLALIFCFFLTSLGCFSQRTLIEVEIRAERKKTMDTPELCYGIDISRHQGNINWNKFDTTISFVICKATEGVKIADPKFKKNWDNIPTIKGCYHFFRPQLSGIDQAKNFLKVAIIEPGNIIPIIDVEQTPQWRHKKLRKKYVKNLMDMVSYIEAKKGIVPIIYTTGSFWDNYISPYYGDKEHILWVADYRHKEPYIPKNMSEWTIWQYSCKGKVSGIFRYVDKNKCKDINKIIIK